MNFLSTLTDEEPEVSLSSEHLCELTRRIDTLTQRQIRDLRVVHGDEKVVLSGRSRSYYIKQLASQAVIDLMPGVAVENAIDVLSPA